LENSGTSIDFFLLSPNSRFTTLREKELNYPDLAGEINKNLEALAYFYENLTDTQKEKINVYLYDNPPKFSLYSCGSMAFVGFYLPNVMAVESMQFIIDGESGVFSKRVWEYIEGLTTENITKKLPDILKNAGN
jgi:hypothetical protein